MYRGGNYNNGANAGVFYVNGDSARSNSNANIGFRSALALLVMPAGYGSAGTIKQKGHISRPHGQRYRPSPADNRSGGQNRVDWPLSVTSGALPGGRGVASADQRQRQEASRAALLYGHCATHGLQKWIEHNIVFKG